MMFFILTLLFVLTAIYQHLKYVYSYRHSAYRMGFQFFFFFSNRLYHPGYLLAIVNHPSTLTFMNYMWVTISDSMLEFISSIL